MHSAPCDNNYKIPDKLATNTTPNAKINEVKNRNIYITNLPTTAALYVKIKEVQNKILNITNLATTTVRTAVGNEISDHSKYITTPEFRSHSRSFYCKISKRKFNKQK